MNDMTGAGTIADIINITDVDDKNYNIKRDSSSEFYVDQSINQNQEKEGSQTENKEQRELERRNTTLSAPITVHKSPKKKQQNEQQKGETAVNIDLVGDGVAPIAIFGPGIGTQVNVSEMQSNDEELKS